MRALQTFTLALLICAASSAASPERASAQAESLDTRYQTWAAAFLHGPITGDLWLWTDLHARFYDVFEPAAMLVRPGLSWRVLDNLWLTLGYAWTPSWRRTDEPRQWGDLEFTDEHRIWQQVVYQPSDPGTRISGQVRVRLEERFRHQPDFDVGFRVRIFLRGQVVLDPEGWVVFALWDEVFVPISDSAWGQRAGFDQNRLFVGFGFNVIPGSVRVDVGYTNQWIPREGTDSVNHIAAVNTFIGWR